MQTYWYAVMHCGYTYGIAISHKYSLILNPGLLAKSFIKVYIEVLFDK